MRSSCAFSKRCEVKRSPPLVAFNAGGTDIRECSLVGAVGKVGALDLKIFLILFSNSPRACVV